MSDFMMEKRVVELGIPDSHVSHWTKGSPNQRVSPGPALVVLDALAMLLLLFNFSKTLAKLSSKIGERFCHLIELACGLKNCDTASITFYSQKKSTKRITTVCSTAV